MWPGRTAPYQIRVDACAAASLAWTRLLKRSHERRSRVLKVSALVQSLVFALDQMAGKEYSTLVELFQVACPGRSTEYVVLVHV